MSADSRRTLREFARALNDNIHPACFSCLVTNDAELQRLNKLFLGHDYPTDVLSFSSGTSEHDLGEMAISLERACAQAAEFGHGWVDEVRILMLHGFLHLAGFDHESDGGEMARAERKWRARFGLPATLIARSRAKPLGAGI